MRINATRLDRPAPGLLLRQVGVEATLKQMDSGVWYPALTRRDYPIAANLTAVGLDDPDAFSYENYKCGSTRNYSAYCNPEVDDLIDRQSRKIDPKKRLALVTQIQQRLEADPWPSRSWDGASVTSSSGRMSRTSSPITSSTTTRACKRCGWTGSSCHRSSRYKPSPGWAPPAEARL
jgi:hypothetical protein